MRDSSPTSARCPLCGGDNQCAIAAGQAAADCWCMTTTLNAAARAQAAATAGERCVCPACGAPTTTDTAPRAGIAHAG